MGRPMSPAGRIEMDTFKDLLTVDDFMLQNLPEKLVDQVGTIREAMRCKEAQDLLAKITHVDSVDLGESKKKSATDFLDLIVATVILLNAIQMGVSADVHWDGMWLVEISFTTFFTLEILIKLYLSGPLNCFCKGEWRWNIFDAILVVCGITESIVFELFAQDAGNNLRKVSVIRMLRLARITRVVRLLRFRLCRELMVMLMRVLNGVRTLFWAFVLLIFVIYVLAIALRYNVTVPTPVETAPGTSLTSGDEFEILFSSVPTSMFTIFRCFTDSCTAADGTPLPLHMQDAYGWWFSAVYVVCFLFVTFGIFNLIIAVFVENTMQLGQQQDMRKYEEEKIATSQRLRKLLMKFCLTPYGESDCSNSFVRSSLASATASLSSLEVSRGLFETVIEDPEVRHLLEDLDLKFCDRGNLFDALDADGSGFLEIGELIEGLMKVRGPATKSDMVASSLGIRAIQKSLLDLQKAAMPDYNNIVEAVEKLQELVDQLASARSLCAPGGAMNTQVCLEASQ